MADLKGRGASNVAARESLPRDQRSCVIAREQPARDLGEKQSRPREPRVQRPWGRSVFRAGAPGWRVENRQEKEALEDRRGRRPSN